MKKWLEVETWEPYIEQALTWSDENIFVTSTLIQLGVIIIGGLIAFLLTLRLRPRLAKFFSAIKLNFFADRMKHAENDILFPIIWLLLISVSLAVMELLGFRDRLVIIVTNLLTAWVVIRAMSGLVRNRVFARLIALTAWIVAALNILDLLGPVSEFLDNVALDSGEIRISLLTVIEGFITMAILLWFAIAVSGLFERRIRDSDNITPSLQVLFSKLIKIFLITFAILMAISSAGIDITALAVFSGAVGVGIGFGLQKIVSNFISGLILLMDRSIKPGDVIEVEDTYGWINKLSARHVSVITRDGKEHLIPNEDLITQKVINWSYSSKSVRIHLEIGVSYKSDIHQVRELVLNAVSGVPRVLKFPKPVCLLTGFGDSSVDFELRFWIEDPANGVTNIKSEIYIQIWDTFKEHNIEIPFPQRDIHVDLSTDQLKALTKAQKS